jgi:terpene synthase-like protein
MTWFFFFDDIMDMDHGLEADARSSTARLCQRHLEMLDSAAPREDDPAVILAFHDYLQQVRQCDKTPDRWFGRMAHHLREYVLGAYWESLIGPTTEANANTAMYLQVRHMAVGVAPCLDLMAMTAGIPYGPLANNFFIQRLERLAINYSIWVNDLAGLGRDIRRGLGNVIFTLRKDHALSLVEATRMVARMCDGELGAFLEVERQLPLLLGKDYEKDKQAYDDYLDVMKRWMRGLLDWSARSDRYQRLDVDMALQNDELIRRALHKRFAG